MVRFCDWAGLDEVRNARSRKKAPKKDLAQLCEALGVARRWC